jgi:hypothetical protein
MKGLTLGDVTSGSKVIKERVKASPEQIRVSRSIKARLQARGELCYFKINRKPSNEDIQDCFFHYVMHQDSFTFILKI